VCNLYSLTTHQAASIGLFQVLNRYVGNLPPMPGVFPDYPAPVGRNVGAEHARWAGTCGHRHAQEARRSRTSAYKLAALASLDEAENRSPGRVLIKWSGDVRYAAYFGSNSDVARCR
jgi:hypothetical protein